MVIYEMETILTKPLNMHNYKDPGGVTSIGDSTISAWTESPSEKHPIRGLF